MMKRLFLTLLLAILFFCGVPVRAQTTGSISGHVADETGGVLPGATVEAKSAALQGSASATTDGSGRFRLPLLPPGHYRVTATLPGFASENLEATVALSANAVLDFVLRPSAKESIVVVGQAPVIDARSTTAGSTFDQHLIQTLPTDRNYTAIAQVTAGVNTQVDVSNPSNDSTALTVYGSSKSENSYLIDGLDTNGVEYGTQGTSLNFEFVQEVEVKTGGYEAEYGRSTGGIINVITKSGGNEFHGDAFGYYNSDKLQANNAHVGETTQGSTIGFTQQDIGADLGGLIIKDRLWFFGAYDRVDNTIKNVLTAGASVTGHEFDTKSTRNLAAGKLTYNLGNEGSVVGSFFQDPRTDTGAINDSTHSLNGVPNTFLGRSDFGGQNYGVRGDYLFSGVWLAGLQAARHKERNSVGPASAAGDVVEYIDNTDTGGGFQTGGFGLIQKKTFTRDHVGATLSRFLGNQEIKGGFEYEKESADVTKRMSGGQQVLVFTNSNPATNVANPFIYQHNYWTTPTGTKQDAPLSELSASPGHKSMTAYVQDKWNILPNLTANLGVRWDRQQIIDSSGVQQIDLKKDFAPRFGFIWDPARDGKTKVYGSFGRYYEEIPMDLVIRSYSYERQPHFFNYSPTDNHISPSDSAAADLCYGKPPGTCSISSNIVGANIEPADPNLHGQYLREFIFGGEREVLPNIAVGLKYIYRNYGEVIEDFLSDPVNGVYSIGNPGEGIMQYNYDLNYDSTPYKVAPAKRIFRGVEVDVTKRFSNHWSAIASYLWSKLDGNYDGEYAPFTNIGPDPNISAAYDYADFQTSGQLNGAPITRTTNSGPLANDRRSQFKVSGTYVAPFGLNVGFSAYYMTGAPLSKMGYSDSYSRYEFFLTQRGSAGRSPDLYEADLHLGYPVPLGPVTVNILADVFNILNAQRAVLIDQRWDFQEADNSSPTPTNPNYGKAALNQAPRSLRLGARVSF